MYKIVNNDGLSYLTDLPSSRPDVASNYSQNLSIPFARVCSFESSFFPSTLRLWHNTAESIRNAPALSVFKSYLETTTQDTHIPSSKDRLYEISLTRIRHNYQLTRIGAGR